MTNQPNLFHYATSELSQDAFLTWLINWADVKHEDADPFLNKCAVSFVQKLLGKDENYQIKTVESNRQFKNIDVWALINNEHFIVIEDKTGTKEHSDQLNRYSNIAAEKYEKSKIEISLVYFKMEEQGSFKNIEDAGYSVFKRTQMLSILTQYMSSTGGVNQNAIIVDFYKNLVELDEKINSYKALPINDWHWYSWQGFYTELQEHFDGTWDYVSNPAGGFLGFWWNWAYATVEGKKFEFYLQLEQNKLIFKFYTINKDDRVELRDLYRAKLIQIAKKHQVDISRYGRVGIYMGVAKLNPEYIIIDGSKLLDFNATVKNLEKMVNIINEVEVALNRNN
jgi:hypothetical protein